MSLAPIVKVSEATVTPAVSVVPVMSKVSAGSVTASSVTDRPVRFTQELWFEPAGMETVTGVAGAAKSPPPVADAGDDSPAVTAICRADPKSLLVAVVNAARTRTAGVVVPSDRVFCSPLVSLSVSAVKVTPRSSSVMANDVPLTANPVAEPPMSMLSAPSAMVSWLISKLVKATAVLVAVLAGMLTVMAVPGAVKSVASASSPALNDNVTFVAPVSVEVDAPAKPAVIVTAPALVAPSPIEVWLSVNSIVSVILKSAGITANPVAEPANRIVSSPSAVVSDRGVIVTSAVADVPPEAMTTSTVAAPRS